MRQELLNLAESTTERGFALLKFADYYGKDCSFQASSLAGPTCCWLGIEDAEPMVMASLAGLVGVETKETNGWVPYPVPEQVHMTTRMHLTQGMAGQLGRMLLQFAETGEVAASIQTPEVEE